MKNCRLALLLATLVLGIPLRGASGERITASADLNFSLGEVTLPTSEMAKIASKLEKIRQADWCPFDTVVLTASAATSEGSVNVRRVLAERRADYVRGLLKSHGVPENIIRTANAPPSPVEFKSRADYKRAVLRFNTGSDKLYVPSEEDERSSPPAESPSFARVELDLVGGGGGTPCPYAKSADGFHVPPTR